ncbi:MAG: hypothetical protein AB7K24_08185 [Gemmataceae bacterium]
MIDQQGLAPVPGARAADPERSEQARVPDEVFSGRPLLGGPEQIIMGIFANTGAELALSYRIVGKVRDPLDKSGQSFLELGRIQRDDRLLRGAKGCIHCPFQAEEGLRPPQDFS